EEDVEYSDSDSAEEAEPIEPDHYYDDTVPVFKPTMEQFASFPTFIKRIDKYGMKAGIVKVIPPAEWTRELPDISTQLRGVRIKNPIVQHISGSGGKYFQTNIEKARTYTIPQWRKLTEESSHQPPARRGQRRMNADDTSWRKKAKLAEEARQRTKSDTAAPDWDTASFEGFDYRFDSSEYTAERCAELERVYWRTLTYNSPLYGADMLGSLFTDETKLWNVARLDNILNDIGKDVPGVNMAYLYFGMWKSTFSWHVEDMDLYSINYIHFGAPKQWYSVAQDDEQKFFDLMRSLWPDDYKQCKEFLRHKTFLLSPTFLANHGIAVNKLVHYQGEFVITFPHGYHSGYNLGYNCAESVNFASEKWLRIGAQAGKCMCVADAVDIDVEDLAYRVRLRKQQARMSKKDEHKEEETDTTAA
ncbi:JmjC domain, hydroxylase-domain-containing protein, partial [Limtongia smithiae]|uniref:JmjC domain, hydroxylase-domain-containing protein n=1 Tax=Limtongia smithiae TaxID=1125753 RepID=UPI0034CE7E05